MSYENTIFENLPDHMEELHGLLMEYIIDDNDGCFIRYENIVIKFIPISSFKEHPEFDEDDVWFVGHKHRIFVFSKEFGSIHELTGPRSTSSRIGMELQMDKMGDYDLYWSDVQETLYVWNDNQMLWNATENKCLLGLSRFKCDTLYEPDDNVLYIKIRETDKDRKKHNEDDSAGFTEHKDTHCIYKAEFDTEIMTLSPCTYHDVKTNRSVIYNGSHRQSEIVDDYRDIIMEDFTSSGLKLILQEGKLQYRLTATADLLTRAQLLDNSILLASNTAHTHVYYQDLFDLVDLYPHFFMPSTVMKKYQSDK